ncbi:hypothetical protein F751_0507 [Auxenochlorella protothecoides]|uniref:Plastid integral membrane protein n=1 Tax=Auxenochlorella protothecoides TaxID=3075 RepID=V5NDV3_AUXPR|nr:hypothetical protein F751_0507 [Auxenochlorella protothecoides]AHA86558.1 plastid integral membrane protein [Auxenochlorella protothecoides]KFM25480.1 hypothetical protein F751_0507 [Auxenochlorella protothecoides]
MFGAGSLAAAGRGSLPPLPSTPPKPIGFAYNERVAAALLPSLIILAGFDGGSMASILMVGGMAVYILDTLRQKEMAFGVAWATLGLALLAAASGKLFLASEMPGILAALVLLITAACLALTGLWISIQFRWIQLQYPVVVAGFEKTLIGGSFPVAAAVQSWALTVAAGVDAAPFLLVALLCTLYHLLALPLEPSLAPRGRGGWGDPGEGAAAFFLVATLPAGMYAVAEAADLAHWVHAWSLLLLASLPLLAVACMPRGLWWLGAGERVRRLRAGLLLASLAAALAGLEARVVFRSYAQYLRLPPPWSYLAVTVAVYGAAALLLLHAVGALEPEVERAMAGPVLVVGAAVGALALGLPLWVMPAPLAAAAGLAGWAETRRAGDYGVFVLGTLLAAAWFLHHHFWFLERAPATWLMACLYASKAALLVLPRARLLGPVPRPGPGRNTAAPPVRGGARRNARPPPGVTALLAAGCVAAVALARFAVFDVLRALGRRRPGEAALLGALLLLLCACLAPLHAPSAPLLQAIIVLSFLALAGVMVALSAPPRAAPAGAFLAGDESSGAPTAWPAAPLLAALWSLGFPLALLAAVAAGQRPVPERMAAAAARLFPDSARDAAAERAMALQAAVLAAWAAQAAVLALALKLRGARGWGDAVRAARDLAGGAALLAPQAWALAGLGSEKAQPLGRAALAALLGLCLGGGLLARSGELKALGAGTAVVLGLQAAEASRARAALHAAI